MKLLILALALLPTFAQAYRVEGPRFVKKFDGGIAHCSEMSQAGSPAYYPTSLELAAVGEAVRFQAVVSFVTCAELEEGKFGWAPRNPLDPVSARDHDGRIILNLMERNEFALVSNQIALVGVQPIVGLPGQTADFLVPLDKVLTPEQKTVLNAGFKVETRFTFFTRGDLHVVDASGSKMTIGLRAGGAYSVLFSLEKNRASGQLEVSAVKFRP